MSAIERDNSSPQGVLPKDYARPGLDKQRLGQLINMVSNIGLGSPADRAKDVLGRVYEYFLSQFASAEGKKGASFIRRPMWSGFWWRCSRRIGGGFTIPAAARAVCSCRARSSLRRTAGGLGISRSMGRSRIYDLVKGPRRGPVVVCRSLHRWQIVRARVALEGRFGHS